MARQCSPKNLDPDVVTRLEDDLEQARASLEDAQNEIAALVSENRTLASSVALLETKRAEAVAAAARARNETARSMELITRSLLKVVDDQELQTALEEASMLAEELREANDALLFANSELEERVTARTAELDQANAKLGQLNAELRTRVEAETGARTRAQAELFQMQKLEAIGQLTGGIAHDFNNLLTVITSGLQLLTRPRDDAHRDRVLARIQEAAWRGADLTQRLLAFARRQPLHPDRLDLLGHMDSMRSLLSHALRDDIEMRFDMAPDVWSVEADVTALELALLNLAVNARDAMPDGGTLTLAARNETIPHDHDHRLNVEPGDFVRISLVDTGTGMAPELLEKVFEPFFSTKSEGKGTGLGLAQVYGFARQSGGDALLESTVGSGTAVHILLPRSLRDAPVRMQGSPMPPVVRRNDRLNVMVVEDDDSVATMVLEMLEELGHSGIRVSTVASALAVLATRSDCDLVFSDVLLPGGGSGLDLAREISGRGIGVPVVLTSGFGGGMTQRLAAANLPFLRKPYRIEALRQAIDTALQAPALAS